jgi:transcriptional regulator of acetoin/glycerol metabolism
MEVVGENPENLQKVECNMKEVKEQIFRLFYDYQVVRGWPHVADRTADILGIDRKTVYRKTKK